MKAGGGGQLMSDDYVHLTPQIREVYSLAFP